MREFVKQTDAFIMVTKITVTNIQRGKRRGHERDVTRAVTLLDSDPDRTILG